MNAFKKRALLCAGFLAGLAALLALCSLVVIPKGNARRDGMLYPSAAGIEAESANTIDVVFIGDSECYYAIMPMLIWQERGYASYVCATPSQKLYESVDWLARVGKTQSPKLVVLEADALYNIMDYSEIVARPFQKVFPALVYHNRWKSLRPEDFYKRPAWEYRELDKGYIYDTEVVAADDDEDYMRDDGRSERISLLSRLYVKRVLAWCEARGARLMLISTPSRILWDAGRHNAVQQLADQLGLQYVDMNGMIDEIGIDWSADTLDKGYHMNYSGAQKVTSCMIRLLDDTGLLPDHRGEKAYARWDKDLKKLEKKGRKAAYFEKQKQLAEGLIPQPGGILVYS